MDQIEKSKKRRLLSNTLFLYLLTFSSQLFNLITVPYLSRVLGPAEYGKIGIATSLITYVQICVDFGFILSATKKVAENRDNILYISKLFFAVLISKITISVTVMIVFSLIIGNTAWRADYNFYMLYLFSQVCIALLPDFIFRGYEDMKIVTYRTLAVRALFTVLIFVFVKDAGDLVLVPLFTLIGNIFALITAVAYAFKKKYICWVKFTLCDAWVSFCDSAQFFLSRVAGSVYQASNTLILGVLYGNASVVTGWFTSANKLMSLTRSFSSPVADSIYPYMIKNKDFKLVKKLLIAVSIPIVLAGIVCLCFAEEICVFIFGQEYYEAGNILRLLLPAMMVIFPTYILTFPIMTPLGLTKQANLSNVVGLIVNVILIAIFALCNCLNVYTLCIVTSVTEVSVFLYRGGRVLYEIKKRKKAAENQETH